MGHSPGCPAPGRWQGHSCCVAGEAIRSPLLRPPAAKEAAHTDTQETPLWLEMEPPPPKPDLPSMHRPGGCRRLSALPGGSGAPVRGDSSSPTGLAQPGCSTAYPVRRGDDLGQVFENH